MSFPGCVRQMGKVPIWKAPLSGGTRLTFRIRISRISNFRYQGRKPREIFVIPIPPQDSLVKIRRRAFAPKPCDTAVPSYCSLGAALRDVRRMISSFLDDLVFHLAFCAWSLNRLISNQQPTRNARHPVRLQSRRPLDLNTQTGL